MNRKIEVIVLHGAISNAGDFLIYERGKKLLESFLGDAFNFTYIGRHKPFEGDFDGLIILGGPLISRKIHPQSRNISDYIKNRNIPIFCMALGISREKFESEKDFFQDYESIRFWKQVYETSKLLSVRDKITYNVLNNYGIKAELTGCSALFNLETLERNNILAKNKRINKIAVTIPYLSIGPFLSIRPFSSLNFFLLTLYFLFILKRKFNKKEIGLIFQHGYPNFVTKIMRRLANIIGMKTYDLSEKGWDSSTALHEYDAHIGTRLHSHIFFLSSNKPSFLFNVDMRTEGFLKTIETPSDRYTISGIKNLVNLFSDRIVENNFDEFNGVPSEITKFYINMKKFLNKIVLFYEKQRERYE